MSQILFASPLSNAQELNTGDAAERGVHPKELVDGVNAMMTELYQSTTGKQAAYTALLGDSRVAQISASVVVGRQSGWNSFNHGNYRAGNRLTIATNQGNSGDRSDQMLARLQACINSGAGHLYILAGLNDIAQALAGYTTITTAGGAPSDAPNRGVAVSVTNVAAIAAANAQYAIQKFMSNGGRVVTLVLDPGAENFGASQVGAWLDYIQRLREMAEVLPGVNLFDLIKVMHDPAASTTSTIRFKSGYAQESSGSGVHQSHLGAYMAGIPFATYLQSTFAATAFLPVDVNDVQSANSVSTLLGNPLMIGTAGSTSTGFTGSTPTLWTSLRSGGSGTQTATIAVQAAADGGPGNEALIVPTFGAAGDILVMKQDANLANVNVGDFLQGMARVTVDAGGAAALAAINLDGQYNDGTTTFFFGCGTPLNNVAIGTDGFTYDMKTPSIVATARSGGFLTLRLSIFGAGVGQGPNVRWKQAQMRKRYTNVGV